VCVPLVLAGLPNLCDACALLISEATEAGVELCFAPSTHDPDELLIRRAISYSLVDNLRLGFR
jgi:hypothetical protein